MQAGPSWVKQPINYFSPISRSINFGATNKKIMLELIDMDFDQQLDWRLTLVYPSLILMLPTGWTKLFRSRWIRIGNSKIFGLLN